MTKVKKSKVTINATKITSDGKKETKKKTFSKNNKKFKKDVAEAKKLLEEVSVYEFTLAKDADNEIQKTKDVNDYKSIIHDTEEILEKGNWFYTKENFKTAFVSFGKGFVYLFKTIWEGLKSLFKK